MLMVAETMPQTSDTLPLIGKYRPSVRPNFSRLFHLCDVRGRGKRYLHRRRIELSPSKCRVLLSYVEIRKLFALHENGFFSYEGCY